MFRQSKIYRWTGKGSTESMYNLLFFNRIYGSSCSWKSRYVEKNSRFPEQIFREQYKSSKHRQNWTEFKNKKRYSTNIDLYIFFENYMRSCVCYCDFSYFKSYEILNFLKLFQGAHETELGPKKHISKIIWHVLIETYFNWNNSLKIMQNIADISKDKTVYDATSFCKLILKYPISEFWNIFEDIL